MRNQKRRTVGEEFTEHECMVGLWVVLGKTDVFVHVERDDMFEPGMNMVRACANIT
jgi:hypothetical protein